MRVGKACFRKMISSGIAIGVTGKFGTAVEGITALVPLNITDFRYEQSVCTMDGKAATATLPGLWTSFGRTSKRKAFEQKSTP